MEESVWVFFGIISFILTIGIITSLVAHNKEDIKIQRFESSVDLLKTQCNYVCSSAEGTLLSVDAELPSGIILKSGYDDRSKFCIEFKDESRCAFCRCEIQPYTLNLSSTEAKKTFVIHNYKCYFERLQDNVRMECQG